MKGQRLGRSKRPRIDAYRKIFGYPIQTVSVKRGITTSTWTTTEVAETTELPDLSGTALIARTADTRTVVSRTTEPYSDVKPDSPMEVVVEKAETA